MPWEKLEDSQTIREAQFGELDEYVDALCEGAAARRPALRADAASFPARQAALRAEIEGALGYPPKIADFEPVIERDEEFASDALVKSARRVWIRVAEHLTAYGILLLPHKENPKLALCFHGGGGCPELVSSVVPSENYNDGARRLVELGFAVFAPLFSLREDATGDRKYDCNYRNWLNIRAQYAGTSIAAIELMKVERALRALERCPGLDAQRVGVAGLSYGGYYAFYAAALIPRIAWCVSSCYFSDRLAVLRKCPGSLADWLYPNAAATFGDAEVGALICPKPLYIEVGQRDEMFAPEDAIREAEKLRPLYRALGREDDFLLDVFDGVHEFSLRRVREFLATRA